jgi:oxygen-independent coproporphyrinogen-3 oxidase
MPETWSKTLDVAEELVEKYNVPGPRYTSYPTAPEWVDSFGPADYEAAIEESNVERPVRPVSLYMHLPFCESLCLFCGCNVVIQKDHSAAVPYLETLQREIEAVARRVEAGRPVVQFHWGGGTPTYLSPEQLEQLFRFTHDRFTFAPDAEIGIEVDPRVTSREHLETLRQLGFNRISMGVQDFNPVVQKTIHRIQPFEETRETFETCRNLAFESINIDLIYGLPHQTPESFVDSVEKVVRLRPDRVAMFSYAHVPWLKKQQGSFASFLPQGMDKFRIFRAGIERFVEAGYLYIGMDHFALPDDELCVAQRERTLHRNFQGYTTKAGSDLFGMGVSAISGTEHAYAQNFRDLPQYSTAAGSGALPTMRGLRVQEDDRIRRAVINRILCHAVLDKRDVEREFGLDFDEYFAPELERLVALEADTLVRCSPARLDVTPLGRIFIRNVAMVFDRYLARPKERPLFSKTL